MSQGARAILSGIGTLAGIGVAIFFHYRDKIEPGEPCDVGRNLGECVADQVIVLCNEGTYEQFTCAGPRGCYTERDNVMCDQSGNLEGDACRASSDGEPLALCSADGKAMVSCIDGKLKHDACAGPKGCREDGKMVNCDQSISTKGAPCEGEVGACTPDKKAFLICKDGRYELARSCRGPKGCTPSDTIGCDSSLAEEGDACQGLYLACSVDKTKVLACRQEKMKVFHVCRGGNTCTAEDGTIDCNMGIAQVGDPCEGDVAACAVDGKTMLECESGVWEKDRACNACVVESDSVLCR